MKKLLILLLSAALIAAACSDGETHVPVTGQVDSGDAKATEEDAPKAEPTAEPSSESAAEPSEELGSDEIAAEEEQAETSVEQCQTAGNIETEAAAGLLPVDPAVKIGTLDNGLTYYVRSNDSPGGALSLRLVVNAGSLNEPFAGAGYAHYLEHMLFNGTEKYPGNEIIDALESIGVEFGPDINAYTSYDETVYMLDLVIDEEEGSVATAFDVLSQWAHAASITPEDVEEERGIIRDEYRLGNESGQGIIHQVFDRMYSQGTPYEGRPPIGTVESIEDTTSENLRAFYEKWYVPSNMAVVAVGDLPLDTLEDLVEEHFCGIPAGVDPAPADNWSALNREATFDTATTPEQSYSYLSLDIRLPSWDPNTIDGDRQLWIEQIISIMVENRLQDGYEQDFLSQIDPTHWSTFSYTRGLRYYGTNLRASDFSAALTDYWSLLLSLAEHGFSDADLERAAKTIRTDLESAIEAAPTVQDVQRADLYTAHFLGGRDIGRMEDTAARVDALLDDLQIDDLTDRYREILEESGLILIAVGPDLSEVPSVEEMQAALAAATPGELPAMIGEASELLFVPDPVDAVSEGPIEAIVDELDDAYEWTFANGARVMYAYSDISENEVGLDALSWGGWSALAEGDRPLAQYLATRAVGNSGLGDLSPAQVSRYLDDRNAQVQPYIAETTEGISGASDTEGVETMFQLMHLYMTEPRVDDQAFAEAANIGDIIVSLSLSDPDWQEAVAFLEVRYGDAFDWFNLVPSQERLDSLTAEELLGIYQQRFGGVDDLVVVVVGDVERDVVEQMARTYVGTLPAKEADSYVNRRTPEPDGVVRHEVVLGPDIQSTMATYTYEAVLDVNPATQVASRVLDVILSARLIEDVREDLGDTYVAGASLGQSLTPELRITGEVVATGAPDQMDSVEEEMARILAEVHAGEITDEEFEQARAVVGDDFELIGNRDLANVLIRRAYASDDELPTPRRLIEELEALELADVQALAAQLFDPNQHIQFVRVLP
ncbi:MAG: insulinase family protein [Acidimicrobiia bacterium]|nr:insulinase family protein [Acidimicrobiia bacterium]MYB72485.1 insulinase family protein [Acidimicrobiia bacterium]MYH98332.1 insulinase family protein [Acidimicrobiia bacterium]